MSSLLLRIVQIVDVDLLYNLASSVTCMPSLCFLMISFFTVISIPLPLPFVNVAGFFTGPITCCAIADTLSTQPKYRSYACTVTVSDRQ